MSCQSRGNCSVAFCANRQLRLPSKPAATGRNPATWWGSVIGFGIAPVGKVFPRVPWLAVAVFVSVQGGDADASRVARKTSGLRDAPRVVQRRAVAGSPRGGDQSAISIRKVGKGGSTLAAVVSDLVIAKRNRRQSVSLEQALKSFAVVAARDPRHAALADALMNRGAGDVYGEAARDPRLTLEHWDWEGFNDVPFDTILGNYSFRLRRQGAKTGNVAYTVWMNKNVRVRLWRTANVWHGAVAKRMKGRSLDTERSKTLDLSGTETSVRWRPRSKQNSRIIPGEPSEGNGSAAVWLEFDLGAEDVITLDGHEFQLVLGHAMEPTWRRHTSRPVSGRL